MPIQNLSACTSVILHFAFCILHLARPSGTQRFEVLEQNYRGGPVSQDLLLALNEGETIDFSSKLPPNEKRRVTCTAHYSW